MIDGVVFDERGFFREIIHATDECFTEGFGQWSHSLMRSSKAKAWHIRWKQRPSIK